jgi:hypothetical protein
MPTQGLGPALTEALGPARPGWPGHRALAPATLPPPGSDHDTVTLDLAQHAVGVRLGDKAAWIRAGSLSRPWLAQWGLRASPAGPSRSAARYPAALSGPGSSDGPARAGPALSGSLSRLYEETYARPGHRGLMIGGRCTASCLHGIRISTEDAQGTVESSALSLG